MTIRGFAAAKGSPGTTTLLIALATAWAPTHSGRTALLVEADADGASINAGHLQGQAPADRGVAGLALARAVDPVEALRAQCLEIVDGRFTMLLGPDCPARVRSAASAWPVLAAALRATRGSSDTDVLVDLGRAREGDLTTQTLLPVLDELVWVTGSSLTDVLATRAAVTAMTVVTQGVVVVGPDRPYGATEVADAVGARLLGTVPYDRHLASGSNERGRFSPWQRAVRALATSLTTPTADDAPVPTNVGVGHG